MKEKILYLLLLSCILTNCSKDNIDSSEIVKDNILLENNDKLTLNQESCSMRIYFTSSGNWEAIVDAKASSWCGLNSSHGVAGSNSIIISVSENTTYDERNASITISTGTAKEVQDGYWKIAVLCAIGGTIGGYIGAKLLKKVSPKIMKIVFTGFLIYVSIKMITS